MITLTPQQAIFYLILGPVALIVILMALLKISSIISRILGLFARNKMYKKMMAEVVEMKKNGDFHDWVTIDVDDGEKARVCRKTGYYPTLDGFFPLSYVERKLREENEKLEYAKFKSDSLSKIASSFGLKMEEIDAITTEIIAIPQKYTVGKLQKLEDELKNTAKNLEKSLNE